jgi:tetratricopeptide (TPR) repeat protein
MRCVGLERNKLLKRTQFFVSELGGRVASDSLNLANIIRPRGEGEQAGQVEFDQPNQPYPLLRRILEGLGRERPVIVWLEDVQWGSDALGFVQYVLDAQETSPSPILFLLTVREEELEERPLEAELLQTLSESERFERLEVEPLSRSHTSELVRRLLRLDGDLARRVEKRSGGYPMYAVQLVGDLVRRGVLEVGKTGFELKEGESAALPLDIHQVWLERVGRFLEKFADDPHQALLSLELAAVLGLDVDLDEWRAACSKAAVNIPDGILETLSEHGLAQQGENNNLRFTDRMLRESLGRMVINAGRWGCHNWSCATALSARGASPERIAQYFIAAGDSDSAVEPLLAAVKARVDASEYKAARNLLTLRDKALRSISAPEDDRRWGLGWVMLASTLNFQARYKRAREWANRAIKAAIAHGWDAILADALRQNAHAARETGDLDQAVKMLDRALPLYRTLQDISGEAFCLGELGAIARERGEFDEGIKLLVKAHQRFKAVENRVGVATCLNQLGILAIRNGQLGRATRHLRRASLIFKRAGNQIGVARCICNLAEVARHAGDSRTAEVGYRKALARFRAVGSHHIWLPLWKLGLVQMERGNYPGARKSLEKACKTLETLGRRRELAGATLALLPCIAAAKDWPAWDKRAPLAMSRLDETRADPEFAEYATLAVELCRDANDEGRASQAEAIAASQWERLGESEKAAALRNPPGQPDP